MGTSNDYFYLDFMGRKKKGQYRCRVQINGKRWNKYFDTKKEAEDYKLKVFINKPKIFRKGEFLYFSLRTLLNEFLEYKSFEWNPSTIYLYSNCFRIFENFFDDWFHLLTKEDCYELLNESNYGQQKLYYGFFLLDEINKYSLDRYNYGLDWSIDSIRKKLRIIRGQRKKPREYHTKEEIKKIANFLGNYSKDNIPSYIRNFKNSENFYHIYRLGLFLGCRGGELCSLKKSNYNRVTKSLLINSTISRGSDGLWKDSNLTKTKTSRINQLSDLAIESVEWLINNSNTPYIIGKITPQSKYEFMTIVQMRDKFKRILDFLDIPWIGTHGMFRKTFATQIAQASNKSHRDMIASIQKQLGHKSPQMTLHYIQAIDTDLSEELSKLDDLI